MNKSMRIGIFAAALLATAINFPAKATVVSLRVMASIVKFDGQKVNDALARRVAADATLLGWANCSAKQTKDGKVFYRAEYKKRDTGSTDVPCLYLVTGSQSNFNEYYLTQNKCDLRVSKKHTCIGSYLVDTRVRTRVTEIPDDPNYQVSVERSYFVPAIGAGSPGAKSARLPGKNSPPHARRLVNSRDLVMQKIGSTRSKLGFGRSVLRSWVQAYNHLGLPIGDAITDESYSYMAYTDPAAGESAICSDLRDYVATQLDADEAQAQALLDFFGSAAGTVIGSVIGGKFGAGPGTTVNLAKQGVGGVVGGVFGAALVGLNKWQISKLTTIKKAILSGLAEEICRQQPPLASDPNTPDAPGDLPIFKPGYDPGAAPSDRMCWQCTRYMEYTGTAYSPDGEVLEQQVENVCILEEYLPC